MNANNIKRTVRIGIAAALAIILFQVSNIFLVYQYFKFDYYITFVAIMFLSAGYLISKYKHLSKNVDETSMDLFVNLTSKELFILKQIADRKSNKEIAAINFVEVSTIKTHINNIYAKLSIRNRREAINLFTNSTATGYRARPLN
jgi:DNA-binding CsgD family transcriptional regulator